MKRCLLLLLLLGCACYSFCQGNDSIGKLRNRYLLKRSHEKKAGNILLFGGIGLCTAGFFSAVFHTVDHLSGVSPAKPNAGETLAVIGGISVYASIPMYIIAGAHRRKAAHLTLAMQKTEALAPAGRITNSFQPALALTFNLSNRKRRD